MRGQGETLRGAMAPRTRRAAWAWGAERLRAGGLEPEDASLEAEVLFRHAASVSHVEVLTRPDAVVSGPEATQYAELIDRRAAGCPTAYLVGQREFFGIDIYVDRRVMVPRPETERLVEVVADLLRDHPGPLIVEIGTGSGAVAVALARTLPRARILATDSSAPALEVARLNAVRAGVADRIEWAEGAGLEPLAARSLVETVDALVANPPYIPTAEMRSLPREVREYEPRAALDGGPDGLAVHRVIIAGARHYLRPAGALALEVASLWSQARAVSALVTAAGLDPGPRIICDYAGAERLVLAARAG